MTDKEQSDFAKLKFQVGHILMQKFLEYNEGKFHTSLEMNPSTHVLTEFIAEQLKQERNRAIDLFKEVLTTLQSKEIEYRECSVESNPNWEYFKGKADAYEFAVKQLKRVFEWQELTAHG